MHFLCSGFLPEHSIKELNKLPSLVQHYFHHTEEHDQNLSFASFLVMHYGDSNHAGEEDHSDLPLFHSLCHCMLFVHEELAIVLTPNLLKTEIHYFENSNHYSCILNKAVFQPPKA